jgi:hypothetical protein
MRDRAPNQLVAALAGLVFLLLGLLGFVPGVTSHSGDLSFAGGGAKLLGRFQVSILHNAVHLLLGIAGLASARTATGARAFLTLGGVLSLALWFVGAAGAGGWIPLNTADNWLHFLLGIGMIGLGSADGRGRARAAAV